MKRNRQLLSRGSRWRSDIFQMLEVLQDLRHTVAKQVMGSSGTGKVVVVDSVTAVVSPPMGGQQREGLALMVQSRELKTLARDFGMAVVVTNHLTRDRDSGKVKPALGCSWTFVPRVLLDTKGQEHQAAASAQCVSQRDSRRWQTLGHAALQSRAQWYRERRHDWCC
jgi:RAD51-like protein 3